VLAGEWDLTTTNWANRIVGEGVKPADQFLANPQNWRRHPKAQREALRAVLDEIGWVQRVIENVRTGHLIDGHERVWNALQAGNQDVPYVQVDVSEEEERLLLATLDPIGAMAETDAAQLDELLQGVRAESEALQQLLGELAEQTVVPEEDGGDALREVSDELEGAYALKPDMHFDSPCLYGIPELREDRLLPLPEGLACWPGDDLADMADAERYLLIYGNSCRLLDFDKTVLAFYTEDRRFESFWSYPDKQTAKLVNAGLLGVVTPNYSLWPDVAEAVRIWNTFRSRWIGRYFQEAGLNVIPDVNWSCESDYRFSFAGIPRGAPCISVQVQTFRPNQPDEVVRVRSGIQAAIEALEPQSVLFYGSKAGRELVADLGMAIPYVALPTLMDLRRQYLKDKKGRLR